MASEPTAAGREAAFYDARCPKCGAHVGWCGLVTDRPPCRRCGHRPDPATLKAGQDRLDADQRLLAELRSANPGWERWREARTMAGLTLRQAAKILGLAPSDLSAVEQCREVPSEDLAGRMSRLYSGENP